MTALSSWNGGVIVISHDERFITTVAAEVRSKVFCAFSIAHAVFVALGMR